MRRVTFAVLACAGLLLPLSARAQQQQAAPMQPPRSDEAKKHLGEIDVYLKDAQNNARALYQLSAMSSGYMDPLIVKEDVSNLDRALAGVDKHLSHVRTLPAARISDPGRLDVFERDVAQARAQLQSLRTLTAGTASDRAQLRDATASLVQSLRRADDDFAVIATGIGLQRVDQINASEKHPVRGVDEDFDVTSPRIHGPGTDSGLGTGSFNPERNMGPDRAVPTPQTPQTSSPEQGAWPRY